MTQIFRRLAARALGWLAAKVFRLARFISPDSHDYVQPGDTLELTGEDGLPQKYLITYAEDSTRFTCV